MADAVASAGAGLVPEQHDLRLRQLHTRGARGDRRIEVEVFADRLGARHFDLAERHRNAERSGPVRHAHGVVYLAGHVMPARLRVAHRVDRQERRLGLHVMHVLGIADAGIAHRGLHALRHLFDHGRPADVFRHELGAHRGADGKPGFRRRP
jgi:hypothetical protein